MSDQPTFELAAAHRYFSAECFNRAWDLIRKTGRTPDEDEDLINLAFASLYHWSRRPDSTDQNRSIGYWQVSHVYALLGRIENARHYGDLCLAASRKEGVEPVFAGYAYEALARAEALAGNGDQAREYLAHARRIAETVEDQGDRQQLLGDLETIQQ